MFLLLDSRVCNGNYYPTVATRFDVINFNNNATELYNLRDASGVEQKGLIIMFEAV